jgi:hypothetical protein
VRQLALACLLALALPGLGVAEFVAEEGDFRCLLEGTKVPGKNFYVFHHRPKRLKKALKIASRDLSRRRYPVGTILQFFPREAMVKRGGAFNREGHGWEFFRLDVSPEGTHIAARGGAEVTNIIGACQGCHEAAKKFDYVCEGHGAASLNLPDNIIRFLQMDPRCASQP